MYRYILRESCSQFDSLPRTSLRLQQRAKKSNIEAGVTFARCCYAHGGAMEALDPTTALVCGEEASFTIQAADQFDIRQTHMDDVFQVAMVPMPRSGLKVAPIGLQGGAYRCTFTPHYATPHTISVRLVGHTIRGSPFTVHVVAGATKEEHTFKNRHVWQQDAVVAAAKRAPGTTRTTALWSDSSSAIGKDLSGATAGSGTLGT